MNSISIVRSVREAYGFVPQALAGAPVAHLLYVVLSALAAAGFGQLAQGTGIGELRAIIVWVPLALVWALYQGQLARIGTGPALGLTPPGKPELSVFLSMLGFMPVLALASVLAFAVAGFFAASVLVALEVDPETLDLAGEGIAATVDRLGQAGTAAVVLTTLLAALGPLLLILRTCAFRPLALERGRFVVFEPGGWTRGQSFALLGAGGLALVLPGLAALALTVLISPDGSVVKLLAMFAVFTVPAIIFFGLCRSVLAQTRPAEADAAEA